MHILGNSIESELISVSIAASELIDIDKFDSYNSIEDVENDIEDYNQTLAQLRALQGKVKATYIYALKQINGTYYFIFDTDTEDETLFSEYEEISQVHLDAFDGKESAGIMNVVDQWGSFNTGAVPIWKDGAVIGVISADIEDAYIQKSNRTAHRNAVVLILTLCATMCVMTVIVFSSMNNVQKMQKKLFSMANYDVLTGLPNRQYLMTYLADIANETLKKQTSFAFLLIDVDNFKSVNDNAGHDAGDELLRYIASYLNSIHEHSRSFRPPAGALNVSARIGGDEFVQVVAGVNSEEEAHVVGKKVLDNFKSQAPNRLVNKYGVGLSIGVALFPRHTENYNVLIKYADTAMYQAKRGGKGAYRIYNDEMSSTDVNDLNEDQEKPVADRRHHRR